MNPKFFKYDKLFQLESGRTLQSFQLAYSTYGKLNEGKDNVIWITHALTANSKPDEWWDGLVGTAKLFDPEHHFIVCANVLGSCYGSTGPLDMNADIGRPYYHLFPELTIGDLVLSLDILRTYLGIEKINTLIGGSLGGQQAIEWAVQQPDIIQNLILLATNARHSPWGIAFNESQRMAIQADRTWFSPSPDAGLKGLMTARAIALLSYRNYNTYEVTQDEDSEGLTNFKASSYQNYQGEKLAKRFNAFSYWYLSKAMDSHNVGRNRGGVKAALGKVKARTLTIAISSDVLFPPSEQKFLANHIPKANYEEIESLYGHDGFLIEAEKIRSVIEKHFSIAKNQSLEKIN